MSRCERRPSLVDAAVRMVRIDCAVPPFASDDLADVVFGDAKLDEQVVLTLDLSHFDRLGVVDQGFGDGLDKFFQSHAPPPLPP